MVFLSAFMPSFFLAPYLLPSRNMRNYWLFLGAIYCFHWGVFKCILLTEDRLDIKLALFGYVLVVVLSFIIVSVVSAITERGNIG